MSSSELIIQTVYLDWERLRCVFDATERDRERLASCCCEFGEPLREREPCDLGELVGEREGLRE